MKTTPDEQFDHPPWMTHALVEETTRHFQAKTSDSFSESDAVKVLLSLSQLFDATGVLKLEIDDEEKVHRVGEGE